MTYRCWKVAPFKIGTHINKSTFVWASVDLMACVVLAQCVVHVNCSLNTDWQVTGDFTEKIVPLNSLRTGKHFASFWYFLQRRGWGRFFLIHDAVYVGNRCVTIGGNLQIQSHCVFTHSAMISRSIAVFIRVVRWYDPLVVWGCVNPLTPNDPYRGRTAPLTS